MKELGLPAMSAGPTWLLGGDLQMYRLISNSYNETEDISKTNPSGVWVKLVRLPNAYAYKNDC